MHFHSGCTVFAVFFLLWSQRPFKLKIRSVFCQNSLFTSHFSLMIFSPPTDWFTHAFAVTPSLSLSWQLPTVKKFSGDLLNIGLDESHFLDMRNLMKVGRKLNHSEKCFGLFRRISHPNLINWASISLAVGRKQDAITHFPFWRSKRDDYFDLWDVACARQGSGWKSGRDVPHVCTFQVFVWVKNVSVWIRRSPTAHATAQLTRHVKLLYFPTSLLNKMTPELKVLTIFPCGGLFMFHIETLM